MKWLLIVTLWSGLSAASCRAADDYEVVPRGSLVRGNLWLSDGPADVISNNTSAGNRFRVGGDLHLGDNYQYVIGWTIIDVLSSGESSPSVGGISRVASDLCLGYFVLPDKLWLMYSFQLGEARGSDIGGHVGTYGHQISAGYRFYSNQNIDLALELAFLHIASETVPTFDFATNTQGSAAYPLADVWSLNLRFGFDIGGR